MKTQYLLHHDQDDDYILQCDNSNTELDITCPRQAEYALVHKRKSLPHEALTFGSAHHHALDAFYSGQPLEEVKKVVLQTFVGHTPELDSWRTPEHALESMLDYIQHYKNDSLRVVADEDKVPFVERSFSLPLGEILLDQVVKTPKELLVDPELYPSSSLDTGSFYVRSLKVFWTGRLDLLAHDEGDLVLVDHKTSSIKGEQYYQQFEMSQATIGYIWATEQLIGRRVDAFLLNLIINRKPTRTGVGREFDRRKFYYPRYRIDEWPQDTLNNVEDFVRHLVQNKFPPRRAWCINKYGRCPYYDVCCAPPERRLEILHSSWFTDNVWTPLT